MYALYKVVKQSVFFLYFSLSGSAEQDESEGSDGRSLGSQEGNKAENPYFKNGLTHVITLCAAQCDYRVYEILLIQKQRAMLFSCVSE
jgi:hypothetical protein